MRRDTPIIIIIPQIIHNLHLCQSLRGYRGHVGNVPVQIHPFAIEFWGCATLNQGVGQDSFSYFHRENSTEEEIFLGSNCRGLTSPENFPLSTEEGNLPPGMQPVHCLLTPTSIEVSPWWWPRASCITAGTPQARRVCDPRSFCLGVQTSIC